MNMPRLGWNFFHRVDFFIFFACASSNSRAGSKSIVYAHRMAKNTSTDEVRTERKIIPSQNPKKLIFDLVSERVLPTLFRSTYTFDIWEQKSWWEKIFSEQKIHN